MACKRAIGVWGWARSWQHLRPRPRHGIAKLLAMSGAAVGKNGRHHFVDALRGFALLGILLVNIEFIVQPVEIGWEPYESTVDLVVRWFVVAFGQTKVYPLFALLFGYGLSIQVQNAKRRGTDLSARYRRRMIGIGLLGVAHGVLFFPGDILVLYAVIGAVAYRFRDTPTPKLLRIAAIVYGIAAFIWMVLGGLDLAGGGGGLPSVSDGDFDTFQNGSFGDVVGLQFFYWPVVLGLLWLVQGPTTFSFFLIGIAIGRTRILADPTEHRPVAMRALKWLPLGVLGAAVGATLIVVAGGRWATIGFAIGFATMPPLVAGYGAILALTIGGSSSPVARVLQASGRMSLSVYLLESIVVSTLSYGYGFGLFSKVGPLAGQALAVAVWLGLSAFAVAWMRVARFGPFEWLLRSFTYGKLQPWRQL